MWHDTTLADDDVSKQLVQPASVISTLHIRSRPSDLLLIIPDGKLQVTRDDTLFLVITRSVASQFKDFGSKILEHRS